jgi:hypothetical protein
LWVATFPSPYVIVAVILLVTDPNPCEPLDASAANIARNNQSNWKTVIGRKWLIIHLVCQQHVVAWVHNELERKAGRVFAFTGIIGSFKVDPLSSFDCHTNATQDIAYADTSPICATSSTRTPIKALAFANEVELPSTVAIASKRDRNVDTLPSLAAQVVHFNLQGAIANIKHMLFPVQTWNAAMVSDVVKVIRGDETGIEECR